MNRAMNRMFCFLGDGWLGDGCARCAAWLVAAASAATLGGALLMQYVGGLSPCPLCLWQRWPYWAAIGLGLAAVVFPRQRAAIMALAGAGFIAGAGVALYHAGIEWRWWPGPSSCSGGGAAPASITDLQQQLDGARVVRCDEAPWSFLGISLAGYNFLISLALAGVSFSPLARHCRRHP